MATNVKPPHFVLLPFMAQGHLIPAVDIAKLLAKRGVHVSILLTPQNANRVKKALDRAIASGLSIRVFHLRLPCAEAGLPEGCEFFDKLPSMHYVLNFFKATAMLQEQVEEYLIQLSPTCLIADMSFPWASATALRLRIPRLVFHGTNCFFQVCIHVLRDSKFLQGLASDTEYFVVPDLPHKIEINKSQLWGSIEDLSPELLVIQKQIFDAEDIAVGTVANTFEELEIDYVRKYPDVRGIKLWCIGPVSLCNVEDPDKAERGNAAAIGGHDCLKWMDTHEAKSVVYICLGSITRVLDAQLIEMGLGLEASERPFVWVIREASDEFEAWLSEERFEERMAGRGLLIRGWAPQMLILSHPSLGGFVTHCGWNSTLEGVSVGVPMATWPIFGDQFLNEKFIVSVIRTGVRIGLEMPVLFGVNESAEPQVRSADVKAAIDELMDGGEEGAGRRERARRLGQAAKRAVEEGGSSHRSITQLIQDMVLLKTMYEDKCDHHISSIISTPPN